MKKIVPLFFTVYYVAVAMAHHLICFKKF